MVASNTTSIGGACSRVCAARMNLSFTVGDAAQALFAGALAGAQVWPCRRPKKTLPALRGGSVT